MRVKPKEKYGKLLHKVECGGNFYQIREKRKYKHQGKGKNMLISGSELTLLDSKKNLIKGGFKTIPDIVNYIIEEIEGIEEYEIKNDTLNILK